MSEQRVEHEESLQADVVARLPMTAEQALERLKKGQPVENAKIERLSFCGEFPSAVRLKNCQLIRPNFDAAVFKSEVAFIQCLIDRPTFHRSAVFEQGWNLSHSTL